VRKLTVGWFVSATPRKRNDVIDRLAHRIWIRKRHIDEDAAQLTRHAVSLNDVRQKNRPTVAMTRKQRAPALMTITTTISLGLLIEPTRAPIRRVMGLAHPSSRKELPAPWQRTKIGLRAIVGLMIADIDAVLGTPLRIPARTVCAE
jgi:hypothetical protein